MVDVTQTTSLMFFVEAYEQSLGQEGAKQLINKVIRRIPLAEKEEYTRYEALLICEHLQHEPAFMGMIGRILQSRISLSK